MSYKRCILPFCLMSMIVLLFGCGLDVEDSEPPSAPVWVEKSLPEEWPERGIDAQSGNAIFLEWEAPATDENVIAYAIYRTQYWEAADSIGDFELIKRQSVEDAPNHNYSDRSVQLEIKYFYKLKALDASDNESEFSGEQHFRLLGSVRSGTMVPNGLTVELPQSRNLSWSYGYNIAMEDYCITLLDGEGNLIQREQFTPGNYTGGTQVYTIPESVVLSPGQVYRWRVDMGAGYSEGRETIGSESEWATFLYTGE